MRRRTVHFSAMAVFAVLLAVGSSQAQEPSAKVAQDSAEAWLSLVDSQNYAASWHEAARLFRNAVAQEKWQATAQAVRTPLGPITSRTVKSATYATTLLGAPDGKYVVFQFNATFERKSAAIETVTTIRENDGTWHVGGYFIN
jgi:hypothetical protein